MISVQNLSKTYRAKHKMECHALKNVSFELPDTGLVFVIGKSGSGKSTLLNMIGGLDKITKGKVVSFGNDISTYGSQKLQDYRNTELGFIFQDFHLLDDLTVAENIALALELQGGKDLSAIDWALEQVDLAGYGQRYPTELSGGQKQRVAIARAIVKKPRLLLADEPTGNLDSKTTTQITELLHKISRNTLVLVVSHNLTDAHNYADRIIELSDGVIINDLTRDELYTDDVEIADGMLSIPLFKELDQNQLGTINQALEQGCVKKLRQKNDKFKPSKPLPLQQDKPAKLSSKHLSTGRQLKLSWQFGKSYALKSFTSALIAAAILMVICLSQMIMLFNPADVIERETLKAETPILAYSSIDQDAQSIAGHQPLKFITDEQFAQINNRVDGKAHKLVNYSLYFRSVAAISYGLEHVVTFTTSGYFAYCTYGTVICNEQFLTRLFAHNGQLNITYADEYHPGGVYITDYMADAIRNYNFIKYPTYESILGEFHPNNAKLNYGYINGIIHTGYAERYADLFERLKNSTDPVATLVREDEQFAKFYDEVKQYLSMGYSTEENFVEIMAREQTYEVARTSIATLNGTIIPAPTTVSYFFAFADDEYFNLQLQDNEIAIDYRLYNQMYDTDYTAEDIDKKTKLSNVVKTAELSSFHVTDEAHKQPHFSADVEVRLCAMSNASNIAVGDEVLKKALLGTHKTFGIYFDPSCNAKNATEVASEYNMIPNSIKLASISTMTRAVEVFSDFFGLIFVVLVAALVIVIVKFGLDIVRRKIYEIGVIKALGGRSSSFIVIFGIQVIVFGLLVCLFAQLGMYFFVGIANDVLVTSLQTLASSRIMMDIEILAFDWPLIFTDSIFAFALCILSSLAPLVALHRVKPINIIKAKE